MTGGNHHLSDEGVLALAVFCFLLALAALCQKFGITDVIREHIQGFFQ